MSYFLPRSTSWWTGVVSLIIGVAMLFFPESNELGKVGQVLKLLTGEDGSPASLILFGAAVIGLRAKQERGE